MIPRADCPRFETCSAPICPMSADSLRDCAWFPDEDVCQLAQYRSTPMVARQRRIARVTEGDSGRGCFTAAMLSHPCMITRGIQGLDPETEITLKRVQAWIAGRVGNPKRTPPDGAFRFKKGQRSASPVAPRGRDGKSVDQPADHAAAGLSGDPQQPVSAKGYTA